MKAAADAAEITPDMATEEISAAMSEAMLSVELDGLTGKAKWTDVIYAMKAAADAAEITPDMATEEISAAMSEAMLSVELDGLTGKAKWTEEGECDKEPKAFVIKDGEYQEME